MNVTQRGQLDPQDVGRLMTADENSQRARERFALVCLEMVEKSSYREVARLTGLSTATLQRWKREAGK